MKIKSNSGGIIKGIAETIKWIGYIGFSLLFVLIFFLAPLFLRWDFGVAFFVGLLVLGVGCLISWLSTRLLQGFGELVQYTAETASYLEAFVTAQQPEAFSTAAADGDVGFHVGADSQTEDHIFEKYAGSDDTVTIPYGTTIIGRCAFVNASNLTHVLLPETLKVIQDSAFFRCNSLTRIELPSGVSSIGLCAFAECPDLTDIFIPGPLTSIADSAFKNSPRVTIHGKIGSRAEQYAKKNNIPFIAETD